eukprot:TRINITY_DN84340_c0_g1_i1.p1 TRINITY_DN84340_c0_g1~~TRINITY_DN84340_c0_g1_i1.p1  ORF type:complete len:179 (+),score=10.33 TRINITY_DN84340_c0_g1_i1:80-616(+)
MLSKVVLVFTVVCLLSSKVDSITTRPKADTHGFPKGLTNSSTRLEAMERQGLTALRDKSGKMHKFGTCTKACTGCLNDHYQSCLVFCKKGCQDSCDEKLDPEVCKAKAEWVAMVGTIYDLIGSTATLCQFGEPSESCPDAPHPDMNKIETYPLETMAKDESVRKAHSLASVANPLRKH